jgi:hypothetical protein
MQRQELIEHKNKITAEMDQMQRSYDNENPNHLLHLLLSFLTMGIWIIGWLIVASGSKKRKLVLSEKLAESKETLMDIEAKLERSAYRGDRAPERERYRQPEQFRQPEPAPRDDTVACPWCAEEILQKAMICKHCKREIVANAEEEVVTESTEKDLKPCYWCAEDIKVNARLCKHCGKEVTENVATESGS